MLRQKDYSQPYRSHNVECKTRIRELCLRDAEFQAMARAGRRRTGEEESPDQPSQRPERTSMAATSSPSVPGANPGRPEFEDEDEPPVKRQKVESATVGQEVREPNRAPFERSEAQAGSDRPAPEAKRQRLP